eukprot:GEMP01007402.1.p1 GENE.GEMP01007402.1~~GEMP01007402.1.p1  ORF type:complete len:743 (+),score=154.22 GEMP01007402.1:125-2353(+)
MRVATSTTAKTRVLGNQRPMTTSSDKSSSPGVKPSYVKSAAIRTAVAKKTGGGPLIHKDSRHENSTRSTKMLLSSTVPKLQSKRRQLATPKSVATNLTRTAKPKFGKPMPTSTRTTPYVAPQKVTAPDPRSTVVEFEPTIVPDSRSCGAVGSEEPTNNAYPLLGLEVEDDAEAHWRQSRSARSVRSVPETVVPVEQRQQGHVPLLGESADHKLSVAAVGTTAVPIAGARASFSAASQDRTAAAASDQKATKMMRVIAAAAAARRSTLPALPTRLRNGMLKFKEETSRSRCSSVAQEFVQLPPPLVNTGLSPDAERECLSAVPHGMGKRMVDPKDVDERRPMAAIEGRVERETTPCDDEQKDLFSVAEEPIDLKKRHLLRTRTPPPVMRHPCLAHVGRHSVPARLTQYPPAELSARSSHAALPNCHNNPAPVRPTYASFGVDLAPDEQSLLIHVSVGCPGNMPNKVQERVLQLPLAALIDGAVGDQLVAGSVTRLPEGAGSNMVFSGALAQSASASAIRHVHQSATPFAPIQGPTVVQDSQSAIARSSSVPAVPKEPPGVPSHLLYRGLVQPAARWGPLARAPVPAAPPNNEMVRLSISAPTSACALPSVGTQSVADAHNTQAVSSAMGLWSTRAPPLDRGRHISRTTALGPQTLFGLMPGLSVSRLRDARISPDRLRALKYGLHFPSQPFIGLLPQHESRLRTTESRSRFARYAVPLQQAFAVDPTPRAFFERGSRGLWYIP